jgi:hypothetical protein
LEWGKDARFLIAGCGNSNFGEKLYDLGFHNICNVDNLADVIKHMQVHAPSSLLLLITALTNTYDKARNIDKPTMTWCVKDMTKCNFPPASFEVVQDKGTLDAMLAQYETDMVTDMLCEIYTALVVRLVRLQRFYSIF